MKKNLDRKIWLYTILIMATGLVALYSASYENVRVPQSIFYNQLVFAGVGLALMHFIGKIDYRRFYDIAPFLYVLTVLMLIWVLINGRHALGAQRWIDFGIFNFQPSEFAKLAIILMLGRYFSNTRPTLSFDFLSRMQLIYRHIIIPLIFTVILMLFIFKQPDLGTSLLLLGIYLTMLFTSGIELRAYFTLLMIGIITSPILWYFLKGYQKDRLLVFLNPNIDPLGAGYTIIQSKIAIGSGQLFGKGWLAGTQNQLNFLPERHTDFIFSVIGEEWGIIGALVLLFFYYRLIINSLHIASQVKDKFGAQVTIGIISILSLQVIINIGMVMGLFPIVGLTLPLVSYGRSSFLIFIIMMGFLLNLSKRRTVF